MLPIVERIQEVLSQPVVIEGNIFAVSASIGVSVTHDRNDDPGALVRAADNAMYASKSHNRGGYTVFDDELRSHIDDRAQQERLLRTALADDLFEVHYQPQVQLAQSRIMGVEALVRIRHPALGLWQPASFLPIAETSGLIVPVGDRVLRAAALQQVAWRDSGGPRVEVPVNLSGREVRESGLGDRIAAAIEDTGIDPHDLTLELTETVYAEATRSFLESLTRLKGLFIF
ncbi:MAG: EAL domain-containing protein [Actinobacteria bacterium]|nr:EAL domain-containing protein [Actinomycetota bacterium]